MNLEKAIEILTIYCSKDARCYNPGLYDSIRLGIEALKALQKARKGVLIYNLGRLPRETDG